MSICYLEVHPPADSPLQPLRMPVSDQADAAAKMPLLTAGAYADGCELRFHVCRHDEHQACILYRWDGAAFVAAGSNENA